MKYLLCAIAISLCIPSQAQSDRYKIALENFKTHFNASDSDGIYAMMDAPMQQQLGIENVTAIVTSFRKNLGKLDSFIYIENIGITEVHKGIFENGIQRISLSLNSEDKLNGLRFLPPINEKAIAKIPRNITPLILPFKGTWFTMWGGDTKPQNYHVISTLQKNAFDFLILGKNNKTYQRSGTRNEDYYAFGQPIYAVCDAEVVNINTGVRDNKPGEMNPSQALGNSIMLKTNNEEYIVYAHFEEGTITLKQGDIVKQGQYLGNCGNSGNSSEPHLHLHIQDSPNIVTSVGVKCYFQDILVNTEPQTDYSPIRLDRISRIE